MAEEVAALALSIINPKSERFIAAILPALRRGSISPKQCKWLPSPHEQIEILRRR